MKRESRLPSFAVRRRLLVCALGLSLGPAFTFAGVAIPRVTWLARLGDAATAPRIRSLLAARGLVDGRDLRLSLEEFPDAAAESDEAFAKRLARQADVIVLEARYSVALREHTRELPTVIYNMTGDLVKFGLAESQRHPGGNVTGTTVAFDEMVPKIWEMLKQIAPHMKRAGLLITAALKRKVEEEKAEAGQPGKPPPDLFIAMHELAASRLGIEIVNIGIPRGADAEQIARQVREERVQGLWIGMRGDSVRQFLKASRIPAVAHLFGIVREMGAHAGVAWDLTEGEAYAASAVQRILRGESPATIPIYRMKKWLIAVNLAAARDSGIKIPPSLLVQADEIYK